MHSINNFMQQAAAAAAAPKASNYQMMAKLASLFPAHSQPPPPPPLPSSSFSIDSLLGATTTTTTNGSQTPLIHHHTPQLDFYGYQNFLKAAAAAAATMHYTNTQPAPAGPIAQKPYQQHSIQSQQQSAKRKRRHRTIFSEEQLEHLYEQSKRQKVYNQERDVVESIHTDEHINVTDEVSTRPSSRCSPVSCADSTSSRSSRTSLSSPNASSNLNTRFYFFQFENNCYLVFASLNRYGLVVCSRRCVHHRLVN
ncbi:hypothetical protein BpHYR1_009731 [Brachionus plicatilis]|uniref:Uncharacterized protein n=1 Tax=Brachionus plicatilis TaxID=10195 RepID=A0A3M7R4B5_BRAPC|nr:hypothetical protein BpHYR1_009731 [Brachionus plicatilis]